MDQSTLHLIVLLLSICSLTMCCIVGDMRHDMDLLIDEMDELHEKIDEDDGK